MDLDKAREIAADVLRDGVLTTHRLAEIREARLILELHSLLFSDARPEQAGMLVLDFIIDTFTIRTMEV